MSQNAEDLDVEILVAVFQLLQGGPFPHLGAERSLEPRSWKGGAGALQFLWGCRGRGREWELGGEWKCEGAWRWV